MFFTALVTVAEASMVTPIRILLVPGHDNEVWGSQYGNTKEADMTLELATKIYDILKQDERFEVYITRDTAGYTKEFADYFSSEREAILNFKTTARKAEKEKIAAGNFIEKETVAHNTVSKDIAVILYGINKWANENKMDAVIHIHFNDYPRSSRWAIGKYKGFAIYLPDGQLPNWKESGQLAANIFIELSKKYLASNYKKELGGLIPDQKLIALGSSSTLLPGVRSVLIEYGYIYDKKFRTKSARENSYENMSQMTVDGIQNYFFDK